MKGSTMSRLDVIETEKTLREQSEMKKELIYFTDLPSVHEKIDTIQEEEIDLQEWLEVFEEDQVKLQGCR
jgi:predicted RNase H-like HicB family nuclease